MDCEVLIVGAGLAGAWSAFFLSKTQDVILADATNFAAGASGIAAGLVSPIMSQRAKPVWKVAEAFAVLNEALAETEGAHLWQGLGTLRMAKDPQQAGYFKISAQKHPHWATWLDPSTIQAQYEGVAGGAGGLWIPEGGALDAKALIHHLLAHSTTRFYAGYALKSWQETQGGVVVLFENGVQLHCKHLILALGWGYRHFPILNAFSLHPIKGQMLTIRRPAKHRLPVISGAKYLVQLPDRLLVGSSYEHQFTHEGIEETIAAEVLADAQTLVTFPLCETEAPEITAGIRVTVPRLRLPMLGRLPHHQHTWVFSGLGSRGLLMAPLLAAQLPNWLFAPEDVWPELKVH